MQRAWCEPLWGVYVRMDAVGWAIYISERIAVQDISREQADPFGRHRLVVKKLRMFMRGTSLSVKRKMTPLTTGALGEITKKTFVGGFGMLQVRGIATRQPLRSGHTSVIRTCVGLICAPLQGRFLFGHMALSGSRTPHFTQLQWKDVHLTKVTCLEENEDTGAQVGPHCRHGLTLHSSRERM